MKHLINLFLVLSLTSCVETVVAGSIAGGVVVAKEKSVSDAKDDLIIETKLITEFTKNGLKNPGNQVGVVVDKQRVLLTGVVDRAKTAKEANTICWKIQGVKEVIDEIQVMENKSFLGGVVNYFEDSTITAQVNSKLLMSKNVSTINVKTITVNKIVYLIGIAKNQKEIETANKIASKIAGVKKVISHIVLADSRV